MDPTAGVPNSRTYSAILLINPHWHMSIKNRAEDKDLVENIQKEIIG
jgi:hypothetical protein